MRPQRERRKSIQSTASLRWRNHITAHTTGWETFSHRFSFRSKMCCVNVEPIFFYFCLEARVLEVATPLLHSVSLYDARQHNCTPSGQCPCLLRNGWTQWVPQLQHNMSPQWTCCHALEPPEFAPTSTSLSTVESPLVGELLMSSEIRSSSTDLRRQMIIVGAMTRRHPPLAINPCVEIRASTSCSVWLRLRPFAVPHLKNTCRQRTRYTSTSRSGWSRI